MTLPVNPNAISLSAIQGEFGGTNPISLSEYYAGAGLVPAGTLGFPLGVSTAIPSSGVLKFGNFHGAAAAYWPQIQKLVPPGRKTAMGFGQSVAISGDGDIIAIGAPQDSLFLLSGSYGQVYIFGLSGGSWIRTQTLQSPSPEQFSSFGIDLALSNDGNVLVVGSRYDDSVTSPSVIYSGAVYVFIRSGGGFDNGTKISPSDGADGDYFGDRVAISHDGATIAVSATFENTAPYTDNGAVYIYTNSGAIGGSYTQQAKLLASDLGNNKHFGKSLALSADGNTLVVGSWQTNSASNLGCIYVFVRSGSSWSQVGGRITPSLIENNEAIAFGQSVAVSAAGDIIQVGQNNRTYFYRKQGSSITEYSIVFIGDGPTSDSVAITPDGATALTGSSSLPSSGAQTLYTGVADVITGNVTAGYAIAGRITASDGEFNDRFGIDVALSGNGNLALVGAYLEDSPNTNNDSGAAYLFQRSYQQWLPTQLAIFAFGQLGASGAGTRTSNRNLVNASGVLVEDENTIGTARKGLAAAGYGSDRAIFAFGRTASASVSTKNLIGNTAIMTSDENTLGTARQWLAAAGYGVNKAIFGFGANNAGNYVSMTNHVDTSGNMSSDIAIIRTIRSSSAASRFGSNRAMFFGGYSSGILNTYNIVNDGGIIGADQTYSGTPRFDAAGAAYGGDKAIFCFGWDIYGVVNSRILVSNTGVLSAAASTLASARFYTSAANYGSDKAIFGFGQDVNYLRINITNLVSNTGVVAADVATAAQAVAERAAAGYSF